MSTYYLGNTQIYKSFKGSDYGLVQKELGELDIEYLIIAQGGSANSDPADDGAGGGAGGYLEGSTSLTSSLYSVVVGTGGFPQGQNSSFLGLTAIGGGKGSWNNSNCNSGGSGGGQTGQQGTTGCPGTAGQGNKGGDSGGGTGNAGGGGGAGAAGKSGSDVSNPGKGGNGKASSISGTSTYYAAGGNSYNSSGTNPLGYNSTGSGGTAGSITHYQGKDGIVIIRYLGPQKATGGTITQSGGYTIHTFTSNGTFDYTN